MSETRLASSAGLLRSAQLRGSLVENPEGEVLGKVEDFVVDLGEVHLAAVILACDEPNRRVAVPAAVLDYDPATGRCRMPVSKETLLRAPSFRADEQPGPIDRTWAADVYSHFCCVPYWF
ncbi:MAG: PRC-barrel domain-containing protein [Planctomycetaceae bacterium]|nr:PRC-barrel domain-containing protein [Planctomycetaceae bacterium]